MLNLAVSAVILPAILKAAAMEGIDTKPLLERNNIPINLNDIEGQSIELESFSHFIEELVLHSKDGAFALRMGENFAFEYLPDIQTYLATCSTLRDAGRIFIWIRSLISPVLDISFEQNGDKAHLKLAKPSEDQSVDTHIHNESLVAAIAKFSRYLLGDGYRAIQINFDHPEPNYRHVYETMFNVPFFFDQPSTEIIFSAALLDIPLAGALPQLNEQAAERVEERLQSQNMCSLSVRLLDRWLQRPELLEWSIDEAAVSLYVSTRTLQRKLKEERTCYGTLQDKARLKYSLMLFRQGCTVEYVSEAMRFSDRRSFTRAFKRWTGCSPREYLDKHPEYKVNVCKHPSDKS